MPTITEGFVAPMWAAVAHAANAGSLRWAFRNKKAQQLLGLMSLIDKGISGRGERIRTSGLYVPNVALYQAKLHPDASSQISRWSGLTLQRESTQVYQRLTEKGRG